MAENYKYAKAYSTIYALLQTELITPSNERTNKIANYYLLKAYEAGDKSLVNNIEKRLKSEKIPKSQEYWDSFN